MFRCWVVSFRMSIFIHSYYHFNHAVRKASAPEKLSDGEYISDGEEGIHTSLVG